MGMTFGGKLAQDPVPIYEACRDQGLPVDWWGRPNCYVHPRGQEPGKAQIILLREDVDALDKNSLHELVIEDDRGRQAVIKDLVFVRARCLTPGAPSDPDAAYLVEAADARWFALNPYYGAPVRRAWNMLQEGSAFVGSITVPSPLWGPAPWQIILDDIWRAVNVAELGNSPLLPWIPDIQSVKFPKSQATLTAEARLLVAQLSYNAKQTAFIDSGSVAGSAEDISLQLAALVLLAAQTALSAARRADRNTGSHFDTHTVDPGIEIEPDGTKIENIGEHNKFYYLGSMVFNGFPAWRAYNIVLNRVGCAISVNPFISFADATLKDIKISLVQIGPTGNTTVSDALENLRKANRVLYDADFVEGTRAKIPEQVSVMHVARSKDVGSPGQTGTRINKGEVTASNYWFAVNWCTQNLIQDAPGTVGKQPGSFGRLWDDMPAVRANIWTLFKPVVLPGTVKKGSNVVLGVDYKNLVIGMEVENDGYIPDNTYIYAIPDNTKLTMTHAALKDGFIDITFYPFRVLNARQLYERSLERAVDYFRMVRAKPLHLIFEGVVADPLLLPGSEITSIAWYDRGQGVRTEIMNTVALIPESDWDHYGLRHFTRWNPYFFGVGFYDPAAGTIGYDLNDVYPG